MITRRRGERGVVAEVHPYPGCFVERVCIQLSAKELTFLRATKSPQQYVRKGVREVFNAEARLPGRAGTENAELGRRCMPHTPGAMQMVIKTKRLREKQFVRP